jgi:hypothetical protein
MYKKVLALGALSGFLAVTFASMLPQMGIADEIRETTTTSEPGMTTVERRETIDSAPVVVPAPIIEQEIVHDRPIVVKKRHHHFFHVGVPGASVNVL